MVIDVNLIVIYLSDPVILTCGLSDSDYCSHLPHVNTQLFFINSTLQASFEHRKSKEWNNQWCNL